MTATALRNPRHWQLSRPLLAWCLALLGAVFILADVALRLLTDQDALPELARSEPIDLLDSVAVLGLPAIGGLIASRRPENLLGWIFLVAGLGLALGEFGTIYYARGHIVEPGSLPFTRGVGWLSNWTWAAGVGSLPFLTLLFPTGRVPSPRWRWALWLSLLLYAVLVVSALAFATAIWDAPLTPDDELPPSSEFIILPLVAALFGLTGLAAVGLVSLVFRYRAAGREEREQLKWFMLAASFLVLALASDNVYGGIAVDWSVLLAQVALYAALAIAILKYRLYDIDILINRTLVYLPLTGILAGLYVVMTSVGRSVFTDLTGAGSDAAVAISTLAVVALLTPLKNQLQSLVDRRFKEQRDPLRALRQLGVETRAVTRVLTLDRIVPAVLEQLQAALAATGAALEIEGERPERLSVGEPSTATPASTAVLLGERLLGRLLVWPPANGWDNERAVQPALDEAAATLAEVLALQTSPVAGANRAAALDALTR